MSDPSPRSDRAWLARHYPESSFGGFTDVDGTVAFYSRLRALLEPSFVVLDVGCGRGVFLEDSVAFRRELRRLRGSCARLIGIDPDEAAGRRNAGIDEFRAIRGSTWPVDDASIDLAVCDGVLEHVDDPRVFFSECRRVIRGGGYLCIRTPNVLSYFGVLSQLVPNRYRAAVKSVAQDREWLRDDVFPARYRCNTRRKLRRMLATYGFEHCVYGYEAEPSYLSFSRLAYLLGVVHQRWAPNVFRIVLFAFARRLSAAGASEGSRAPRLA